MKQRPLILHRILLLFAVCICAVAVFRVAPVRGQANETPGAEVVEGPGQTTSLFDAFFVQRNRRTNTIEWLGTLIIWFLLALSVATFALIGVFHRENRRELILPQAQLAKVRRAIEDGELSKVPVIVRKEDSCFCTALRTSLREADAGHGAMIRALEQACEELTSYRMRRVEILNIIGSVSPMIGLFGTVYGMILAFREIVASGGSPDPIGLAAGIGTALTTTFWGLVVAIPALAGYALLRNTIDALTTEAALEAEDIVNHFRSTKELDEEGGKT